MGACSAIAIDTMASSLALRNSEIAALDRTTDGMLREILFVDSAVKDYATLAAGVKSGIEVAIVRAAEDGIAQMTAVLASQRNIKAVHIVSHGAPGRVAIGDSILSAETLPHYAAQLHNWRKVLADDAEILIYGCQAGLGGAGDTLLDRLAEITGANVAASTTATGSVDFGGNWDFEKSIGPVEASPGFVPEVLETYTGTLAIFTVTNGSDSGAGSLREAIEDANATAGADEIRFNGVSAIDLMSGELTITDKLTINGQTTNVRIERNAGATDFRIFNVTGGATTTFENVTVANGTTADNGGGILSSGEVNLIGSTVSGNTSGDRGGGINTTGQINLTSSHVSGNSSTDNGGGLYNRNGGITIIDNSTVSGNSSNRYGGGVHTRGQITLTSSTVSGNSTRRNGGGLYSRSGNITVTDSTVSNNTSNRHGGGVWARSRTITLTNSTVSGNSTRLSAGGVYASTIRATDSTVSNNTAGDLGGGLYATGTTDLTNSTVSGNSSGNKGGGIYFRNNLTSTDSTISENFSDRGGGVYSRGGGTVNFTNSTISGNSSSDRGGGIFARGRNGGTITTLNSTIANNTAGTDGGGILRDGGNLVVTNTIVANNTASGSGNDLSGTFNTVQYSLIGDAIGATLTNDISNLTGVDPRLAPLANNGGDTQTHALLASSPAIDAADPTTAIANDQRGVAAFGTRDIGAFELGPPQPIDPRVGGFNPPVIQEIHVPPLNVQPNGTTNDINANDTDETAIAGRDDRSDRITFGDRDTTVRSLGGNDNVFAGGGDDFIQLNQGNDYALGRDGNDTIWGGKDNDYAEGNNGNDRLEGHIGNDTLWGADGDDSVFGGLGNALPVDSPDTERDFLDGGNGNDFLNGNAGNDTVYGAAGDDTVLGGKNDDLVVGGSGNDEVSGQEGNDTIYGVFIDAIDPGVGFEIDTLTGGGGADTFVLGVANQRYYDSSIATDNGGDRSYALITDFAAIDTIQLAGVATDYSLRETIGPLPAGIGIFFESNRPDELIAIVRGSAIVGLDLNSMLFQYA